jgi:hypothetical protein
MHHLCMVAEPRGSAMAMNGPASTTTMIAHAGVDNVIIDQDNVNQLMVG